MLGTGKVDLPRAPAAGHRPVVGLGYIRNMDVQLRARRYGTELTVLLALFVLRVLAQSLIAIGRASFLPAWEEWFSGLIPYPTLLASQLVIILIGSTLCVGFWRGTGLFVTPRRWLGSA